MEIDLPSLLLGAVLSGVASFVAVYSVNRLILNRRENRDDVRDLVATIEESAAWVSDALQLHFEPSLDPPDFGVIERNLRLRIFRGYRRLPPTLQQRHLRGRAIQLNGYMVNVFGLLGRVNQKMEDAILWINDEARELTGFLEHWLSGVRKPTIGPPPSYGTPYEHNETKLE